MAVHLEIEIDTVIEFGGIERNFFQVRFQFVISPLVGFKVVGDMT